MAVVRKTFEWEPEYKYNSIEEIIEKCEELDIIYGCDFDVVINTDKTLSLIDLQEANYGDIESERFDNLQEIVDRLKVYLYDHEYLKEEKVS